MKKVKIFEFLLKPMTRVTLFCAWLVTTNGFAFNLDKSLEIYFFCVKRQAKIVIIIIIIIIIIINDFQHVESTQGNLY